MLAFLPWFEFMADNKLVASTIAGRQYRQICIQRSTGAHNILSLLPRKMSSHFTADPSNHERSYFEHRSRFTDATLINIKWNDVQKVTVSCIMKEHERSWEDKTTLFWSLVWSIYWHDRSITALLIGAVRDDSFKLIRPHSQCRFWWSKKNTLDHTRMSEALSGKFTVPIMKERYHFICTNMIVIGIISDVEFFAFHEP